jgi:nucleotide-binding universal stress UspA family protein
MITLKNVLVACDFGEASETALAYGRAFARTFGADLHVLHVVEDFFARIRSGEACDNPNIQAELDESAHKRLEALVTDEDRGTLKAKTVVRTSKSPALAISSYAKEANIDVIVIGKHGRGNLTPLVLGSVADNVVRTAPCPVLVVRHPEHEFVLPDALEIVQAHA